MSRILFVGRTTIDLIYLVDKIPVSNTKKKALDFLQAAGGPACNASVIASNLGSEVFFYTMVGCSPLTEIIKSDLNSHNINFIDFSPYEENLATSSIFIEQDNGNRTVMGSPIIYNQKINFPKENEDQLKDIDFILWDGYYKELFDYAKNKFPKAKVILDADRWHSHLTDYKDKIDIPVAGETFVESQEGQEFLNNFNTYALTKGEHGIDGIDNNKEFHIDVDQIKVIDTLGAGDFFHGAFIHYYTKNLDFQTSLKKASKIASLSCQEFGTRSWLKKIKKPLDTW